MSQSPEVTSAAATLLQLSNGYSQRSISRAPTSIRDSSPTVTRLTTSVPTSQANMAIRALNRSAPEVVRRNSAPEVVRQHSTPAVRQHSAPEVIQLDETRFSPTLAIDFSVRRGPRVHPPQSSFLDNWFPPLSRSQQEILRNSDVHGLPATRVNSSRTTNSSSRESSSSTQTNHPPSLLTSHASVTHTQTLHCDNSRVPSSNPSDMGSNTVVLPPLQSVVETDRPFHLSPPHSPLSENISRNPFERSAEEFIERSLETGTDCPYYSGIAYMLSESGPFDIYKRVELAKAFANRKTSDHAVIHALEDIVPSNEITNYLSLLGFIKLDDGRIIDTRRPKSPGERSIVRLFLNSLWFPNGQREFHQSPSTSTGNNTLGPSYRTTSDRQNDASNRSSPLTPSLLFPGRRPSSVLKLRPTPNLRSVMPVKPMRIEQSSSVSQSQLSEQVATSITQDHQPREEHSLSRLPRQSERETSPIPYFPPPEQTTSLTAPSLQQPEQRSSPVVSLRPPYQRSLSGANLQPREQGSLPVINLQEPDRGRVQVLNIGPPGERSLRVLNHRPPDHRSCPMLQLGQLPEHQTTNHNQQNDQIRNATPSPVTVVNLFTNAQSLRTPVLTQVLTAPQDVKTNHGNDSQANVASPSNGVIINQTASVLDLSTPSSPRPRTSVLTALLQQTQPEQRLSQLSESEQPPTTTNDSHVFILAATTPSQENGQTSNVRRGKAASAVSKKGKGRGKRSSGDSKASQPRNSTSNSSTSSASNYLCLSTSNYSGPTPSNYPGHTTSNYLGQNTNNCSGPSTSYYSGPNTSNYSGPITINYSDPTTSIHPDPTTSNHHGPSYPGPSTSNSSGPGTSNSSTSSISPNSSNSPALSESPNANREQSRSIKRQSTDDDDEDGLGPERKKYVPQYVGKDDRCVVCDDDCTGTHYRVMTCEGCKGFFRRAVQGAKYKTFVCKKKGNCEINHLLGTRQCCQACRWKKCLAKKMDVNSVLTDKKRQELHRKKEVNRKLRQQKLDLQLSPEQQLVVSRLGAGIGSSNTQDFYFMEEPPEEIDSRQARLDGIQHVCQFVRLIPGVQELPENVLHLLLTNHMLDLSIMRLIQLFDRANSTLMFSDGVLRASELQAHPEFEGLFKFIQRCANIFKEDPVMLALLTAIRFLSADGVELLTDMEAATVQQLQNSLLIIVGKYIKSKNICKEHLFYRMLYDFEAVLLSCFPLLLKITNLAPFVHDSQSYVTEFVSAFNSNGADNSSERSYTDEEEDIDEVEITPTPMDLSPPRAENSNAEPSGVYHDMQPAIHEVRGLIPIMSDEDYDRMLSESTLTPSQVTLTPSQVRSVSAAELDNFYPPMTESMFSLRPNNGETFNHPQNFNHQTHHDPAYQILTGSVNGRPNNNEEYLITPLNCTSVSNINDQPEDLSLPEKPPNSVPQNPPNCVPQNPSNSVPLNPPNSVPQNPPNSLPQNPPNSVPLNPPNCVRPNPPNSVPQNPPNCVPPNPPNSVPLHPPNCVPQTLPNSVPLNPPNCVPQNPPNSAPQHPPDVAPQHPPDADLQLVQRPTGIQSIGERYHRLKEQIQFLKDYERNLDKEFHEAQENPDRRNSLERLLQQQEMVLSQGTGTHIGSRNYSPNTLSHTNETDLLHSSELMPSGSSVRGSSVQITSTLTSVVDAPGTSSMSTMSVSLDHSPAIDFMPFFNPRSSTDHLELPFMPRSPPPQIVPRRSALSICPKKRWMSWHTNGKKN